MAGLGVGRTVIDLAAALRAVVEVFDRARIEYVVVGSMAAAAWGVARTTRDVDVVTVVSSQLQEILTELVEVGLYIPMDQARGVALSGGSFNLLDQSSGGKVDLFVEAPADAFTRSRLSRRIAADVLGVRTWVATPEDVVLAKLRWRLESRSEVQWRDCVEIAAANELDLDYVRHWSPELGVENDLDDLLAAVRAGNKDG